MTKDQAVQISSECFMRAEQLRTDCWNWFGEDAPNAEARALVDKLQALMQAYAALPDGTQQAKPT